MVAAGAAGIGEVTTSRLVLRPASAADAAATWRYRRRPEVNEWLTRGTTTLADHEVWFSDPTSLAKTMIIERNGRVVGDLMVEVQDGWGQAEVAQLAAHAHGELGWVLDSQETGRGYASEAVGALIRACFDVLDLRRVTATCFAANSASWRLMERVGMRRECYSVEESLHRSGIWMDSVTYALLRSEWSAHEQEDQR